MHSSELPILILGSPGNLFPSLGCKIQETVKEKQDCGVGTSHLPSNNHASLLAVNHYISLWAAHTTEQQSSRLLGTESSAAAMPIRLTSQVNLAVSMPIFATSAECWSAKNPAFNTISMTTWCCWSRAVGRNNNVPSESLHPLIVFLCPESSCAIVTLCRMIKMLIFLLLTCIFKHSKHC